MAVCRFLILLALSLAAAEVKEDVVCPPIAAAEGTVYWKCSNGQCIDETWRCDGDQSCTDSSDEDLDKCKQDFAPIILKGSQEEFMVIKGEQFNLVCEVAYRRQKDSPDIDWSRVQENEASRGEHAGTSYVKSEKEGYSMVSVLHLLKVTESNTYTCKATNTFGSATVSYRVNVYDPEIPPTTSSAPETPGQIV